MSATKFNLFGKVVLELIDSVLCLETLLKGDVGSDTSN